MENSGSDTRNIFLWSDTCSHSELVNPSVNQARIQGGGDGGDRPPIGSAGRRRRRPNSIKTTENDANFEKISPSATFLGGDCTASLDCIKTE